MGQALLLEAVLSVLFVCFTGQALPEEEGVGAEADGTATSAGLDEFDPILNNLTTERSLCAELVDHQSLVRTAGKG